LKFGKPDPKPGYEKFERKFAWLPVKCEPYFGGPTIWLEHYVKRTYFTRRTLGMGEGGGWRSQNWTLEYAMQQSESQRQVYEQNVATAPKLRIVK